MLVIGIGQVGCNRKIIQESIKLSSGYVDEGADYQRRKQLKSMMTLCTNHQKHGSQSTLKPL